MKLKTTSWSFAILIAVFVNDANCVEEVYASSYHIVNMFKYDIHLSQIIQHYIFAESNRLVNLTHSVHKLTRIYASLRTMPLKTNELHQGTSVSFALTKWKIFRNLQTAFVELVHFRGNSILGSAVRKELLGQDNLIEAAISFCRLFRTYNLTASSLEQLGGYNKCTSPQRMSVEDWTFVFHAASMRGDVDCAKAYLDESYQRIHSYNTFAVDNPNNRAMIMIILEQLSWINYYFYKQYSEAAKLALEYTLYNPDNLQIVENAKYFKSYALNPDLDPHKDSVYDFYETSDFDKLCVRSVGVQRSQVYLNKSQKLKCQYETFYSTYYVLQPLKVEWLNIQPPIFQIYNFVSNATIKDLIDLSKNKIESAKVFSDSGDGIVSTARIGKACTIEPQDESDLVRQLKSRIQLVTGLNCQYCEYFQVVNYGLAGHYLGHWDHWEMGMPEKHILSGLGNRIATFIMYLNDVELGGATVFPQLNISVQPVKGSALYWVNLDRDLHGITELFHGSCPVIRGSKWITTLWFHEYGQEFLRPCLEDWDTPETIDETLRLNWTPCCDQG